MKDSKDCDTPCSSSAARLNRECFCKTLDHARLNQLLGSNPAISNLLQTHPQLFSHTAVFISPQQREQMRHIVAAVERVVHTQAYCTLVLAGETGTQIDSHTAGVFMGFDFHLSDAGPQLIEINTNAGGGFLNAALVAAQNACCNAAEMLSALLQQQVESELVAMFHHEWRMVHPDKPLNTLAIVDENPSQQFLYPEFLLAQQLLEQAGIKTLIINSAELDFSDNRLRYRGEEIDMVYNRLTDFSLCAPHHRALRLAYEHHACVLTPNPLHHRLYADKRNLAVLSDAQQLAQLGIDEEDIKILCAGIPPTQIVHAENASRLWQQRKSLFFKPATGFGSRATYRGDKLTTRVWEEILQGNYVAQQQIPPSERGILVNEEQTALKVDIRAYVYAGHIQLLAARLYQGQTTNFRTQGGGFASVFVAQ